MSVSINNLFNYSRSLPVPFDTMTNKKVKVASMYGAKTESTLCGSVIKAVHAMCRCMNGTGEGAVGQIDTNKSVAEYKSSIGPDAYHLVVFDAASGSALASVYDKNTELIEQYVAHPSQRDGAAIFFALMPFLMSDAEFDETFQEYYDQFIAGYGAAHRGPHESGCHPLPDRTDSTRSCGGKYIDPIGAYPAAAARARCRTYHDCIRHGFHGEPPCARRIQDAGLTAFGCRLSLWHLSVGSPLQRS